jgi:hypothetical protein
MNSREHDAPTGNNIACVELIVWKSKKEQNILSCVKESEKQIVNKCT